MKRFLLLLMLLAVLCSCTAPTPAAQDYGVAVTDVFGQTAMLTPDSRVVCCYASFAECWLLAGGQLVGVTEDAVSERTLPIGSAAVIGSVKRIDLEQVVSLEPDYVILSADLSAHTALRESLSQMQIPCGYFRVDTFDDYAALMQQFCAVSGREDLFAEYVTRVKTRIDEILAAISPQASHSALLLRAFSTGVRAKTDDNLAGQILREFGVENIADRSTSLLEDLSMEQLLLDDPDYILAVPMGDADGAAEYLSNFVEQDPAWRSLSAVQNGRYLLLPQELFHYKPNHRWAESYEYLAKIFFPELFE